MRLAGIRRFAVLPVAALACSGCAQPPAAPKPGTATGSAAPCPAAAPQAGTAAAAAPAPAAGKAWSLFDGKTLSGWKKADMAGGGEVEVKDGALVIHMGQSMTGIVYGQEPPARMNYEIELEAKRVEGNDFFCGLTFPVGKDPCSLVVAGWAGTIVGLSSIDGFDASDNPTTKMMEFKNNRWYRIRVRVTQPKIEAWIDNEQVVNLETADKKVSIRMEMEPCVPLGVATYETTGALRDIRFRKLE